MLAALAILFVIFISIVCLSIMHSWLRRLR